MEAKLIFEYDRIDDTLFVGACQPTAEQETDEIADSVVAKINRETKVVEGMIIMYLTAQITRNAPMQIEVQAQNGEINGWKLAPEFEFLVGSATSHITIPEEAVAGLGFKENPPKPYTYPGHKPSDISKFEMPVNPAPQQKTPITGANGMIPFDPSEIERWADQPDAFHRLPELIRHLVMATTTAPSLVDIPSGSAVRLPGFDGLITVIAGNTWVPKNQSVWEFGTGKNPKAKADGDYRKRTDNPDGIDTAATTFVFVTPRQWTPGKRQWADERRAEGRWADVRAFDANDLTEWLSQAPAVATRFAQAIGKLPASGYRALSEWWENWSAMTEPNISPALVIAGRQDSVERIAEVAQAPASSYYVQADTREEAIAFVAASALHTNAAWGSEVLAKSLVVQSETAWDAVTRHRTPLVLIKAFPGNASSHLANSRGHHVIVPLYKSEDVRGEGTSLPTIGREDTEAALTEMGMNAAAARALAWKAAHNLPIMRRFLIDEAGGDPPAWVPDDPQNPLPALMTIGQWDESNEHDKAIIANVTGQPYDGVGREIAALSQREDSPVQKFESRWRFLSHEEAWHVLAPRLTASDMQRFEESALAVLSTVSTMYELPVEWRHAAGLYGKGTPHSKMIRKGIARTLALMGTRGERTANVGWAKHLPGRILRQVLDSDDQWEIWASLQDDLSTFAEAAPGVVLEAIEQCLDETLEELFRQESNTTLGRWEHMGIIWALERIAWSSDHFAEAMHTLARLAQIDPGGRIRSRPADSLANSFLPWFRQTEATDAARLQTLADLLVRYPAVGWATLINAYPPLTGAHVAERPLPLFRPWGQGVKRIATCGERDKFVAEMERLLLAHVGDDVDRWASIIEAIARLSPDARQQALEMLHHQTDTIRRHPKSDEIWDELRRKLNHQRRFPNGVGAMPPSDLEQLEAVYEQLTPSDPAAANVWPFTYWPALPSGESHIDEDFQRKAEEARSSAIKAAYQQGGDEAVVSVAENAQAPSFVGTAFADSVDAETAVTFAIKHLNADNQGVQSMAIGILTGLFQQSGWLALDDAIGRAKTAGFKPQTVSRVFLSVRPSREAWTRLDLEDHSVQSCYWEQVQSFWLPRDDTAVYIAEKLLEVERAPAVASWGHELPLGDEILIRTLEQLPQVPTTSKDFDPDAQSIIYGTVDMLKKLDESPNVDDAKIAHLEMALLPMIPHLEEWGRDNWAIYRVIAREPLVFADFLATVFKPDGQSNAKQAAESNPRAMTLFVQMMFGSGEMPGKAADGTVDYETLSNWVGEARRLCAERELSATGDDCIGRLLAKSPAGEDGIEPCEAVRKLLENVRAPDIRTGFAAAKSRYAGAVSATLFADKASEYRKQADAVKSKWPATSRMLRSVAESWQQEADRTSRQEEERHRFGL